MFLLTQSKKGVSAMQLHRDLGISTNAAWRLKRKLMQVMVERDHGRPLDGLVQWDDAYLGGERSGGKRGRGAGAERNPKSGRPYKCAYGEPEAKAQEHFTDPESRIMKTSTEGFQQCDNAQAAVDGANQLVVSAQVSANTSDQGQMMPLLEELETTCGQRPAKVLADAGYCNEADLEQLEALGIDSDVAVGREGRRKVAVDPSQCPARARMAARLETTAGRTQYAKRTWLSEAPFGWIKQALEFRQFSVRGLQKVSGEWDLVCLALNIKRMRGCLAVP